MSYRRVIRPFFAHNAMGASFRLEAGDMLEECRPTHEGRWYAFQPTYLAAGGPLETDRYVFLMCTELVAGQEDALLAALG